MATHEVFDSVSKTPLTRDTGHSHEVTDQARHLRSTTGEKGASVTMPQHDSRNIPEHGSAEGEGAFDTEAHFSTHPKNMRGHLPSKEETK